MSDQARESEFFKYYEPFKAAVADRDRTSRPAGVLRSSDDRALTSFAQLGALRLRARRCAISFFDATTQYVLAEATQTLSLQTDLPEDPKDALLWGVAEFPLIAGLCQYTIRLPMEFVESSEGLRTEVAVNCIPDMSQDPRFCDLPFVCAEPSTRFYAAVPIRSPDGLPLGSYCVMGDEVRPGLTYVEIAFLKDMATTVMVHLEMVRAREETRRNAMFIHGLGSFTEGKSSIWEDGRIIREPIERRYAGRKWYEQQYAMHQGTTSRPSNRPAILAPGPVQASTLDTLQLGVPKLMENRATKLHSRDHQAVSQTTNRQQQLQGLDVRHTFARAANVIRESANVDGVAVYDASMGTFAGALELDDASDHPPVSNTAQPASQSVSESKDSSDSESHGVPHASHARPVAKCCQILGYATATHSSLHKDAPTRTLKNMPESLLRKLLKRYPSGWVFNLDEISDSSSSASESEDARNARHTRSHSQVPRKKDLNHRELKVIRKLFPGIRSMMLVPFYDTNRKCNYAGGIVWSTDVKRVLSLEQGLTYLGAFADSVMAEVARIEAKMAERTKSDFISSISHELRSPLHGILGSVQCLQDMEDRGPQIELMHTAETCGKTLLDTIDHLLDFANINDFSRASDSDLGTSTRESGNSDADANNSDALSRPKDAISRRRSRGLESNVNLANITEEVVRTVQAGYAYANGFTAGNSSGASEHPIQITSPPTPQNNVAVVVDIDRSAGTEWLYRTQAGAWRRIVMNIFGNALKYTAEGQIRVHLQASPLPLSDRHEIILTVSDTGCGISREFQQGKMFTPFAQEDYLAPGNGLGLSIVKRIVKDMRGKIMIRSEKGQGTTVQVRTTFVRSADAAQFCRLPDGDSRPPAAVPSSRSPEEIALANAAEVAVPSPTPPTSKPSAITQLTAAADRKAKRILLVDDNQINLRLLVMHMKKQGHHYETASDGLEAFQAFQKLDSKAPPQEDEAAMHEEGSEAEGGSTIAGGGSFDYVLMDISMPVMDGLESTRRIRAHERQMAAEWQAKGMSYKPATIIALTGVASTQTRQEAYSSSMDLFMLKPFKMAELSRIIAANRTV